MLAFNALHYFSWNANVYCTVSSTLTFYFLSSFVSLSLLKLNTHQIHESWFFSTPPQKVRCKTPTKSFPHCLSFSQDSFFFLLSYCFLLAVLRGAWLGFGMLRPRIYQYRKLKIWRRKTTLFKPNLWWKNAFSSNASNSRKPTHFSLQRTLLSDTTQTATPQKTMEYEQLLHAWNRKPSSTTGAWKLCHPWHIWFTLTSQIWNQRTPKPTFKFLPRRCKSWARWTLFRFLNSIGYSTTNRT